MRDDDRGDERRELLHVLEPVLVDVDDDVRRRELADPVELDVLRAADLGDRADDLPRVDAEPRPPDELRREAEVAEELGDAGNEADDARVGARRRVLDAGRVDERDIVLIQHKLLGPRAAQRPAPKRLCVDSTQSSSRGSHGAPVLAADRVQRGRDLAQRRHLDRLHQLAEDVAAAPGDLLQPLQRRGPLATA